MPATITYNGLNPFGARTPLIEQSVVFADNNGYISEVDRFTLTGTRPRPFCNATFADYKNDIDYIINSFHLQFKEFKVIENGGTIFSFPTAQIRSISFPQSSYQTFYEYEIVIDCVKSYENLGIIEPQETYEISQEDSPATTIRHSISCRGIGASGVENAATWVEQKRISILPWSVTGNDSGILYPVTLSRNYSVNRLTAEVSLTTVYLYNEEDLNPQYSYSVFTDISCELSENENGTTITIQGSFQGNSVDGNDEMDQARYRFEQTDWQALAQKEWEGWGGASILGDHISFSVNENPLTAQVDFTMVWDSNSGESPYIQENATVIQSIENPTCFRYQAVIKSDRGCAGQKFEELETLFESTNWTNRAIAMWGKYGTGETLSLIPKAKSVTKNKFSPSISVELQFCHDPAQTCGCAENLTYTLAFVDDIEQYVAQPVFRGHGNYVIQDLGFKNRKKFTIQGSARTSKCCTVEQAKFSIKNRLNFLCAQYFPGNDKILDSGNIEESKTGDVLNFNYVWSAAAD